MSVARFLRTMLTAQLAWTMIIACTAQEAHRVEPSASAEEVPFFVPSGAHGVTFALEKEVLEYSYKISEVFPARALEAELRARFATKGWLTNDSSSSPYEFYPAGGRPIRGSLVRFVAFVREGCYSQVALIYPAFEDRKIPRASSDELTVSVTIAKTSRAAESASVRQLCLQR